MILLQKPNKKLTKDPNCIRDKNYVVADHCLNNHVGTISHQRSKGYVKLYFQKWVLYNCYVSPNNILQVFKDHIDKIMENIRAESVNVILTGDLNSKSPLWGSNRTDGKGEYLTEWLNSLKLVVITKGSAPTLVRGSISFIIDVTFTSEDMANNVTNWKVSAEKTMSLHSMITFTIKEGDKKQFEPKSKNTLRWRNLQRIFRVTLKKNRRRIQKRGRNNQASTQD